jgi:ATP-dependent helicase HepA
MEDLLNRRVTHRFNPDLGTGRIVAVEDRTVVVEFPSTGAVLRLAAGSDALRPVVFTPGSRVRLESTGEEALVDRVGDRGAVVLSDGREVAAEDLWPLDAGDSLFERLATGDVDPPEDFSIRLDALHLASIREADGLGSFLGGRIEIFPHQLHVAENATRTDPVRWLLADEVGLGKTVEACLILNHLLMTGRVDRTLVVAPETLTVQWLGELWRKYHQVFVLLDEKRLQDVERDYGAGFNPFDAYAHVVVGLGMLRDNPWLAEKAVEAGIDLLIVDEAHHLRRRPGHPGNPEYRAIQPIAEQGGNVLLLTATPLEDDAHGFFRLLQLLRPEEFPASSTFDERLSRREPLPPCTSATRRVDIGGLPPREPAPVEIDDDPGWVALRRLESAMLALPADDVLAARRKAERVLRALSSGAALEAILDPRDEPAREAAQEATEVDPRLRWLAEHARRWGDLGEKTLVFAAHRETLETIRSSLSRMAQLRTAVFHEELSPARRDIEVAQFRMRGGPPMLISTECGGEGRNFQFCNRIVMFDLPWDPMVVEQRIGRLDRIGRTIPVEIVYFRPPSGLGSSVVALYESLGLFREPLGGVQRELAGVPGVIREAAVAGEERIDPDVLTGIVNEAKDAYDRVQAAAYHTLHRDPYRPDMERGILARIPPDLEDLMADTVLAASERLGLGVEVQRDGRTWSVEFGNQALVESLPGVPGGSNFLGTFDRPTALDNETIEFFASGHPLVEGILSFLEDSPMGRVSLLHVQSGDDQGLGLLAIYRSGPRLEPVVVDVEGRFRPEWARLVTRRPLRTKRVRADSWVRQRGWATLIRSLARHFRRPNRPVAVAAIRVGD